MVADVKFTANTVEVSNFIKRLQKKIPNEIQMGLARASAFGIKQITDKTQKGQLPDGGRLSPYKKSPKKSRSKRG